MKRNKLSMYAIALLTLGMAACSQEDDFTPQNEWKDAPITVASAQVGELVATRTTTEMPDGDFGLYVSSTNKSTSSKYNRTNMEWEGTDNVWSAVNGSSAVYCTGIKDDQKVWAYSPYQEGIQEGTTLLKLQMSSSGVEDWLYAYIPSIDSPEINLAFKHLMTKVTVSFAGTDLDSETDNASDVTSVSLSGLLEEATLDLSGVENPLTAATDASYTGSVSMAKNEDGKTFSAIILPYEKTGGTYRISIAINSSRYTVIAALPIAGDNQQGFLPGYHYTITIKQVGENKVEIGNMTETPWNTQEEKDISEGLL